MTVPTGPTSGHLDAAIAGLRVDRDTVLQARAAILAEVDRLNTILRSQTGILYQKCGHDPVSADAVIAFSEKIELLLKQCQAHVSGLQANADLLAATARSYGYSDAEIANSFSKR